MKYQGEGDELPRQPHDRFQNQVAAKIKKALAHPDGERPGRKAISPNVIGKMNKVRIRIVDRISADVFVEKDAVSE